MMFDIYVNTIRKYLALNSAMDHVQFVRVAIPIPIVFSMKEDHYHEFQVFPESPPITNFTVKILLKACFDST